MTFDWQDVVALTVVFAAAVSLARRAWRKLSARRPVVGCTHCSACPSGGEKQLVTVSVPSFNREPTATARLELRSGPEP